MMLSTSRTRRLLQVQQPHQRHLPLKEKKIMEGEEEEGVDGEEDLGVQEGLHMTNTNLMMNMITMRLDNNNLFQKHS